MIWLMHYKIRRNVLCLLCMLASVPAYTQGILATVELLDKDAATSVFCAEGKGVSESDALENARINVLRKIIYDGVVDFNGGMPLVRIGTDTGQNPWLKNLFDGKVATYKTFLGGVELVGDFDRDASTYICKANVVVKHSFLKRQIDMQVNGAIENPSPEINYQRQASTHRWSVQ